MLQPHFAHVLIDVSSRRDMGSQPWDVCVSVMTRQSFGVQNSRRFGVQASMVILRESGAFVCGSKTSMKQGKEESLGEIMLSRKYCFVRAVAPTEVSAAVKPNTRTLP